MELRKRSARRREASGDEDEKPKRPRGRPRSRGKPAAPPSPSPPPSPRPGAGAEAEADPGGDPMDPEETRGVRDRFQARNLANARNRAAFYAHYDPSKDELHPESLRYLNDEELYDEEEDPDAPEAKSKEERVKVVDWSPSRIGETLKQSPAPSPQPLFTKCLELLCSNIYGVESLEGVPEGIKSSILIRLMELGKIRFNSAKLFTSGVVPRIAIPDCSKLAPEEFSDMFQACFLDGVELLELGFCGRPLRDEFLHKHRFTHLKKVRIHGNYLVTDDGVRALISASRGLTDIQLVECTKLTESTVEAMASCLGENLRRLSVEGCTSMPGAKMAPFLARLTGLNSLSLAGLGDVSDELVGEVMMRAEGNLEELDLSRCKDVSDLGMAAVGGFGSRLKTLHLKELPLLTDETLKSLAGGCKSLEVISLDESRNFSDEALANLFTACGRSLREVSLRVVREAGDKCLVALAEHARLTLEKLDASFCRKMSEDGFGHLADSCTALEQLTVFGCSQITQRFEQGHSNKLLRLVGIPRTCKRPSLR